MMSNKCGRCWCLAGACVLLLQRNDSGGRQVTDAVDVDVDGSGVLRRIYRRALRGSGSPSPGASVSVGANNAAGTAPPATTDKRNKRRRLRSPQRQ